MAGSAGEALAGADIAVILTEWPEFAKLDWRRASHTMAAPILVDLRNLIDPAEAIAAGLAYTSVGRPSAMAPGPWHRCSQPNDLWSGHPALGTFLTSFR